MQLAQQLILYHILDIFLLAFDLYSFRFCLFFPDHFQACCFFDTQLESKALKSISQLSIDT